MKAIAILVALMATLSVIAVTNDAQAGGMTKDERAGLNKAVKIVQAQLPVPIDPLTDLTIVRMINDTMYYTATVNGDESDLLEYGIDAATEEAGGSTEAREFVTDYIRDHKQELIDGMVDNIKSVTTNRMCSTPSLKIGMSKGLSVIFTYEYASGITITTFKINSRTCALLNNELISG